jgi:hypothetical protein
MPMTPQERETRASKLRKQAMKPGVAADERKEMLRRASNLVKLNSLKPPKK